MNHELIKSKIMEGFFWAYKEAEKGKLNPDIVLLLMAGYPYAQAGDLPHKEHSEKDCEKAIDIVKHIESKVEYGDYDYKHHYSKEKLSKFMKELDEYLDSQAQYVKSKEHKDLATQHHSDMIKEFEEFLNEIEYMLDELKSGCVCESEKTLLTKFIDRMYNKEHKRNVM